MVEVSIVKCNSYDDAEYGVKKSLELIGGIGSFIKPQDTVLLKPNLLTSKPPEKAITTHPEIVKAMINMLQKAGCEVIVGDSAGGRGLTDSAYEVSGIKKVVDELGVGWINFDLAGAYTLKIPNGKVLKEIPIAKPVVDADVVISLPKLKTHALTLYTGAIKNMYGAIPGGNKSLIHAITNSSKRFSEALIDLYSVVPMHVSVMDGIVGMEGLGPHMGNPKKSSVVLASKDALALDAVSSTIMGFTPSEIPMLRFAEERGLGTIDLAKITVLGESVENVKIQFKKPYRLQKGLMFLPAVIRNRFVETPRLPYPVKKKCNECKICEENCPVAAIKITDGPQFDYDKCIRCYVCHELCPEGGIKLKKSLLQRNLFRTETKR
ncbi:MAG: DUF362 domain-containing protein [Thermoplasmata archaeon]|nr:MAG: DUF362 domain-containing protein [Thermoplasmata archaeon]